MFDFICKGTALFSYFQIFLNFFYTFFYRMRSYLYMRVFPCSSLVRSGGVGGGVLTIIHTRTHKRAHTRAREFLDRNF